MKPLLDIGGFDEWVPLSRSQKPDQLFTVLGQDREEKLREEFARWLLALLKAQVQNCIRRQDFPVVFDPLSPAWAARKAREGQEPGFWRATNTLCNTLTVWKEREEKIWHLGWPERLRHPENNEPISVIAEALEFGDPDRNLPARPLFTPLAERMKRSIYRLFYTFCREKHPRYLAQLPKP